MRFGGYLHANCRHGYERANCESDVDAFVHLLKSS